MGILDDIALVTQLSGLHAIMLIALAARLLRIPQCEAECANLEELARRLRALLLQWPAPTGRDMPTQLPAMAVGALAEADGLVGSYRRSTLWRRVRDGRSMETRLRGMQDRVDCLCALVICVHANLLTVHPASETDATNHHAIGNLLHGAEACDDTGTGQGGAEDQSDNTEPGGFESPM